MHPDQLSDESVDRIRRSRIGWFTVLRPDGSPHTTPVWFVSHRPFVWIATSVLNAKVRYLEYGARVSIAIEGSADAPLVAEGSAELVPRNGASGIAAAFAGKYDGGDIDDATVDGERVLIRIRVSRWLFAS